MEAQPLFTDHQAYSKKALFTIKICISSSLAPVYLGMLRKTGIYPYIGCFWWFLGVIERLGCCMDRYGHIWMLMVIYGALVYIRFALYI